MAKARTRNSSSVTPINRKSSEVKELRKTGGNGNLDEEIRRRAYELFQERGGEHGHHHEDWLRAEAEVRSRYANRTA